MIDKHNNMKARNPIARLGAIALGLTVLIASTATASAQNICMDHGRVAPLLGELYTEGRVAVGLAHGGALLEVYAAADGTTWTIVLTTPGGHSCVMASGEGWDLRDQVAATPQT